MPLIEHISRVHALNIDKECLINRCCCVCLQCYSIVTQLMYSYITRILMTFPYTGVEQKIILFHFGNQFNRRWLYVSGLDVLGQSPRHNIYAFIELPCYLNCFIKIAYIMLNKFSDSEIF